MGKKIIAETVGDIRAAIRGLTDDTPIQFIETDGSDYRRAEVQSLDDSKPEGFVRFVLLHDAP